MCYEQRRTSSSDTEWLIRHIPLQKNLDRLVIISEIIKKEHKAIKTILIYIQLTLAAGKKYGARNVNVLSLERNWFSLSFQ